MWKNILNFMGLILMTAGLTAFVIWACVNAFPHKEPVDKGYKIAPTDEELKEIELGP